MDTHQISNALQRFHDAVESSSSSSSLCDKEYAEMKKRKSLSKQSDNEKDSISGAINNNHLSYQNFIERLHSYQTFNWFAKSSLLSPISCVLSGWSNVGPDELACSVCSSRLHHAVADDPTGESCSSKLR